MFYPQQRLKEFLGILEAFLFKPMAKSLGKVWVEIQFRLQEQCLGYNYDMIHLATVALQESR